MKEVSQKTRKKEMKKPRGKQRGKKDKRDKEGGAGKKVWATGRKSG